MISVVVPLYNCEKAIDRCMESLQKQIFSDFEVIMINDGSSDNSESVALNWTKKDKRFRLYSQKNAGVSAARNAGIVFSNGDHICFIDVDDYVENNYLYEMFSHYQKGRLTICNIVHNDSKSKLFRCDWKKKNISFSRKLIQDYLVYSLGKQIAFSACNKLFDNTLIKNNHIRFPNNIKVGEDMIFVLLYLSKCNELYFIDKGLYHYCISNTSAMNSKKDYLPLYELTLQELKKIRCNNCKIDKKTLSLWSRECMTLILTNPAITCMNYGEFKKYFKLLKNSELYKRTRKADFTCNIKRVLLTLVMKTNSNLMLFLLIKYNKKC